MGCNMEYIRGREIAGTIFILLLYWILQECAYYLDLRKTLVSSFLTLGGFIFTIKVFILTKAKECIESPAYQENFKKRQRQEPENRPEHLRLKDIYKPVKEISTYFFYTVCYCFVTAFSFAVIGKNNCFIQYVHAFLSAYTFSRIWICLLMVNNNRRIISGWAED